MHGGRTFHAKACQCVERSCSAGVEPSTPCKMTRQRWIQTMRRLPSRDPESEQALRLGGTVVTTSTPVSTQRSSLLIAARWTTTLRSTQTQRVRVQRSEPTNHPTIGGCPGHRSASQRKPPTHAAWSLGSCPRHLQTARPPAGPRVHPRPVKPGLHAPRLSDSQIGEGGIGAITCTNELPDAERPVRHRCLRPDRNHGQVAEPWCL